MRLRTFLLIATVLAALAGFSFFVLSHVQHPQPTPVQDHAQSFTILQHPLVSVPSTGDLLVFTQVTVSGMMYQYEQQHEANDLHATMPQTGLLTSASNQVHCPTTTAATDNTMLMTQQVSVCPSRHALVVPRGRLQDELSTGPVTALGWLAYNVGLAQAGLLKWPVDRQQPLAACLAGVLVNEVPLSPDQTKELMAFFASVGEQPAVNTGLRGGQIGSCIQL